MEILLNIIKYYWILYDDNGSYDYVYVAWAVSLRGMFDDESVDGV